MLGLRVCVLPSESCAVSFVLLNISFIFMLYRLRAITHTHMDPLLFSFFLQFGPEMLCYGCDIVYSETSWRLGLFSY